MYQRSQKLHHGLRQTSVPTAKVVDTGSNGGLPTLRCQQLPDGVEVKVVKGELRFAMHSRQCVAHLGQISSQRPSQHSEEMVFYGYVDDPAAAYHPPHLTQCDLNLGKVVQHPDHERGVECRIYERQVIQISAYQEHPALVDVAAVKLRGPLEVGR